MENCRRFKIIPLTICVSSIREKVLKYTLNFEHDEGQHKARVFKSVLNIEKDNYILLENALKWAWEQAIRDDTLVIFQENQYGRKYRLNFSMGNQGKVAHVCSIWMHKVDESCVRLVTCYVDI